MNTAWFVALGSVINNPARMVVRIALVMAVRTAAQAIPFSWPLTTSRTELIAGSRNPRTLPPPVRTAATARPGD